MGKCVLVLGATGHIGSYLIPQLTAMGCRVIGTSRGGRTPYSATDPAWQTVEMRQLDRSDAAGLAALVSEIRPDAICDLVNFNMEHTQILADAVAGLDIQPHLLVIGTIWIYGHKHFLPVTEDHPRTGWDAYGINKAAVESYLLDETAAGNLRATVVHPGHISGRGWLPINPQGHVTRTVFEDIRAGKPIVLPDDGSATLQHVHASDIAGLLCAAIAKPEASVGESFHAVCPQAMTLRGYAEAMYKRYGHEPNMTYIPREELLKTLTPEEARITKDHTDHSPVCSMEKARCLLGFEPQYTALQTVIDALESLDL